MKTTIMSRRLKQAGVLATVGCLCNATSLAQADFTMSDLSISPRLTAMSGGDFAMEAPIIGDGEKSLQGGDYTMAFVVTPLPPVLSVGDTSVFIVITGADAVVTWTPGSVGFVLEATPSLGLDANWQPVNPAPTEPRFVAPLNGGPQFFRLRRP